MIDFDRLLIDIFNCRKERYHSFQQNSIMTSSGLLPISDNDENNISYKF